MRYRLTPSRQWMQRSEYQSYKLVTHQDLANQLEQKDPVPFEPSCASPLLYLLRRDGLTVASVNKLEMLECATYASLSACERACTSQRYLKLYQLQLLPVQ